MGIGEGASLPHSCHYTADERWGQLSQVLSPVRGRASSVQPSDIIMVPGSRPDQGCLNGFCWQHRPWTLTQTPDAAGPCVLRWQHRLLTSGCSSPSFLANSIPGHWSSRETFLRMAGEAFFRSQSSVVKAGALT